MKSLTLLGAAIACALWSAHAGATDWNDWPTKFKTDGGYEFGVRGTYQFDIENFSSDDSRFDDTQAMRREEFYGYVKKDGVFELAIGYDFSHLTRNWVDDYLKIYTKKAGSFRFGQFKTPVAWDESAMGAGATVFLERALPDQAVYENRRVGADWTYEQVPNWLFNVGYFGYQDLHGDNDGDTFAGRVVWNPVKTEDEVVHLGVAASREDREDNVARVRARPEGNLTPVRLVDTGALPFTDHIDRFGVEGGWKHGPWLVQSEYLSIDVARGNGRPDFSGGGFYVFGSYVLTGEGHPYKSGAFNNVKPKHDYGAVELALRYSEVDLNDGVIRGGKQHDWTLGANWYVGAHLKLQANYVRAYSDRGALSLDPNLFEVRVQVGF